MKKGSIHIIGYRETKITVAQPVIYSNNKGFELRYTAEDEIRMGLWASQLEIYIENVSVTNRMLPKNFLATFPNKYEPFSHSGEYCFIPTCPILNNASLLLISTVENTVKEIADIGFLRGNSFASSTEKLLLNGEKKLVVYDCPKNETKELLLPYKPIEVEFAHWIDNTFIRLMVSSKKERVQKLINYNIETDISESYELPAPNEVFEFSLEPYQEILTSDHYCLFNAKGYSFASVGQSLNQWNFVDYDRVTDKYTFRTNVPVSGIYKNKNWKLKGIDTIQQTVEYDFNGCAITGKENKAIIIGKHAEDSITAVLEKKQSCCSKLINRFSNINLV